VDTAISPSTRKAGYWAAIGALILSLIYIVGQLAEWFGWMGSGGGVENPSTLLGIVVLLTPSLFLAPAFVVLIAALHVAAPRDRRVWSLAALAFATAYAVLVGLNYYVQLTLIAPRMASGRIEGIEMFLFTPFDSFSYSMDILGYSFMSVATLLVAQTLDHTGTQRVARLFLIANGLLLPFLLLQIYWHWLIWIAALWAVTFPGAAWTLALLFRRAASLRDAPA
jgi:hypothetical protein